jgi:hypothetical protein
MRDGKILDTRDERCFCNREEVVTPNWDSSFISVQSAFRGTPTVKETDNRKGKEYMYAC